MRMRGLQPGARGSDGGCTVAKASCSPFCMAPRACTPHPPRAPSAGACRSRVARADLACTSRRHLHASKGHEMTTIIMIYCVITIISSLAGAFFLPRCSSGGAEDALSEATVISYSASQRLEEPPSPPPLPLPESLPRSRSLRLPCNHMQTFFPPFLLMVLSCD